MTTNAEAPPRDWREGRRMRALELHEPGWSGVRIAQALGVTGGAVSQWLRRAREGGREALRTPPPPGPTPRLTEEQRQELPTVLARAAEAHGFVGDVWTTKRVATVIRRESGVQYHPAHVSRLLRAIGWSVQRPIGRASQRQDTTVQDWHQERRAAREAKPRPRSARSSR